MLHRVPLKNVKGTELKKGTFSSKLHITFTSTDGKDKEIVIISKNNNQIKEILDGYVKP